MPRKKSDFKPLTYTRIIKENPKRKELKGTKKEFKKLVVESTKHEPFDKKKD